MAKPRIYVVAKIGDRIIAPNGKEAVTLLALVNAGQRGITSLEAHRSGWAYRLAAYVGDLRTKFGVPIETLREAHDNGYHARYRLTAPVEIISETGSAAAPQERMAAA